MTTPDVQATSRLPWDAADPYPYYERLRHQGGVVWDDSAKAWLVLGYHPARQILGGRGWTSDPLANPNAPLGTWAADPDMLRRNMLFADGVSHDRLRGAVRDVFTRSFITGLRDGVDAIAAQTIDLLPTREDFDFMAQIALPLPIAIAAAWLGLDVDSTRLLRAESPAISRMLSDFNDVDAVEAGTAAFATLLTEFLPLAADRRRHPGDDLLSFISADPNLELDDVVITAIVIAIAGHETTANLLGSAMVRLLTPTPEGVRPVEAIDVIDVIDVIDDRLVTELLRLDGPVQAVTRTATQDHIIDNVAVRAGEPALVVLAAANRDPVVYNEANQFQADRRGPAPLAFGYGVHYCLGAALARLEMVMALRHILARRPELCGAPIWRDNPAIRGPQTLRCVFSVR
ncbi:putative cytochrome P450 [Mycobacterium intracellulare M.i.198]|nr:cytochrome P450 [Mycobacterium intracellulare]MCA2231466.1 cytochrome P450 [Mycobacterium intracellulare]MDM3897081.1 cytochrome P450 [Mycobacterium intracellulare]BCP39259.1 putative cytochrome P450 [Mycobacterium intracellulare M.i.198]